MGDGSELFEDEDNPLGVWRDYFRELDRQALDLIPADDAPPGRADDAEDEFPGWDGPPGPDDDPVDEVTDDHQG